MNPSIEANVDLFNNCLIDFLLFLRHFSGTHVRAGVQVTTPLANHGAAMNSINHLESSYDILDQPTA